MNRIILTLLYAIHIENKAILKLMGGAEPSVKTFIDTVDKQLDPLLEPFIEKEKKEENTDN